MVVLTTSNRSSIKIICALRQPDSLWSEHCRRYGWDPQKSATGVYRSQLMLFAGSYGRDPWWLVEYRNLYDFLYTMTMATPVVTTSEVRAALSQITKRFDEG